MKMIIASILCLTILSNFAFAYKKQGPPRANDLSDHFGSNPSANQYGPVPPVVGGSHDLMRQGMLSGIPITPIKNFSQEVQPKEVVAGNFLNTAPDASLIIKPKLAEPKAKIDAIYRHEAVVKTPVHLGDSLEERHVTTMDRLTGKISTKIQQTNKPILGVLNTVREVETPHTTVLNLRNNHIISNDVPKLEKVGI